jgi:hypothetical protein
MPQEPLFSRLFLHADISPVPLLTAPNDLPMPNSDLPLRIGDLRATFDGPDLTPRVEWGKSWTTWKWAVEESFRTEFARVIEYARPLAAQVRVAARDTSDAPSPDVTFEQPHKLPSPRTPRAGGHRLHRALADAVGAHDRQPSPFGAEVIDLEHWGATVDALFSPLPPASDEVLAVSYDFLPVLTEWLRAEAAASVGGRHLIRADLGLPGEVDAYCDAAARLRPAVQDTLSRLADGRQQGQSGNRLAGHRSVTRVVSALQDDFPRGTDRVELGVVFAEHPDGSGYVVPAVGMRFPQPRDGFPLRLTDGTVAHLSTPPWHMGWSWDPRGGERGGGKQPQGKRLFRGWGRRRG